MKTNTTFSNRNDRSLCWTMRLIGLVLIVGSFFFLYKDLSLSMMDNVLFTGTSLLGLVTVAGSWTTARKRTITAVKKRKAVRQQKSPAFQQA